jgi:hypothetical protein
MRAGVEEAMGGVQYLSFAKVPLRKRERVVRSGEGENDTDD